MLKDVHFHFRYFVLDSGRPTLWMTATISSHILSRAEWRPSYRRLKAAQGPSHV